MQFSATTYRIAVDGVQGASGQVVLNWYAPKAPLILVHPETTNVIANAGEDAVFVSLAVGSPKPTNQWQFSTNSATFGNIQNATNATYTINNVQTNHAGEYRVIVGNSSGSATSEVAGLIVWASSSSRLSEWYGTSNEFVSAWVTR